MLDTTAKPSQDLYTPQGVRSLCIHGFCYVLLSVLAAAPVAHALGIISLTM
jgi:hypothetical protein